MPFLRFTRDKRGYETTSLVHASRGRQGRSREKVLYWFRTPPNVKVGRPALDEEAIRLIEERNPDIDFDWPKILASTPPPAPQTEETKVRRGRRVKVERRSPERRRPVQQEAAPAAPIVEAPEAQAIEQITHPDAEEAPVDTRSALDAVAGPEQLVRLRARYAELQARITERGGEAARVETLRAQAETLNPDSWVTAGEVQKGLAEFEPRIHELRAALGLRRRRRSRRGGRRHGRQTPPAPSSSNSPGSGGDPAETAGGPGPDGPGGPDGNDGPEHEEGGEPE